MIKTLLISFLSISELIVSQEETEIFLKLKPNKNIKLVILELSWQRGPRHRHPAVSVRLIYRPDVSVAVCLRLVFFEAFWSFLSFWICMCEQVSLIGCLLWHHICRFSNPPPPASRPAPPWSLVSDSRTVRLRLTSWTRLPVEKRRKETTRS